MSRVKKIISIFLSVLVGIVFVISAISKLPSLEQFGWTITETTFLNWTTAEWSARILIGMEFFLGLIFIFQINIKKIAIPVSLFLLAVFTIYLSLVMKSYGAHGNCGCFGEWIPMTPLQSIVKNIVLIILILVIATLRYEFRFKYINLVTGIMLASSLLLPSSAAMTSPASSRTAAAAPTPPLPASGSGRSACGGTWG